MLVAGGAGSVGHAAIELAGWRGAHVVATVSSDEKAELARAAGAHEVVNYRRGDAAEAIRAAAPDGVHRVVEVAPATNLALDLAVCASDATIAAYASDGGGEGDLPVRPAMSLNATLRFVLVYTMPDAALRQAVAEVGEAIREGALTTLPIHRFPLERSRLPRRRRRWRRGQGRGGGSVADVVGGVTARTDWPPCRALGAPVPAVAR